MSDTAGFPVAACRECARDVLTYLDERATEPGLRRCVHCDERIAATALRETDADGLVALGYELDPDAAPPAPGCAICPNGQRAEG